MVGKIFRNRQKHQRRRRAWVGQADFGKLWLNNRNHSENYHHLSLNSKQKIKQRAKSPSVRALSLPWTGVDFIITTILHSSPFSSVAAQSIHNIYLLKVKFIVLKKQLLELLRALHRILLYRRLRSLSNLADQVPRFLLLRKDESTFAGQTIKKKCCCDYGPKSFDRLESRGARNAWDNIAKKMNDKFGTKKTTHKY